MPAQPATPAELQVQYAKWSPDGGLLAFAYDIPDAGRTNGVSPQDIAVVDLPDATVSVDHA